MNIILASRNSGKIRQVKELFLELPIWFLSLDEVGVVGQGVEDGQTLEENALKKALYVSALKPNEWIVSEDSGIFIDALDGRPGVRSARWAGEHATTEEITAHTLKQMEGKTIRSATFKTVVALILPSGDQKLFVGKRKGFVLKNPMGVTKPGMPYSSIFVPDGSSRSYAEMSIREENAISHRGRAFRRLRTYLEGELKAKSN